MEYDVTAKDTLTNPKLVFHKKFPYEDTDCLAAFVAEMNAKASQMKLDSQTVFYNPSGREADGVSLSTAKSLAIMTAYATGYPDLCEVWSKNTHTVKRKNNTDINVTSTVFTNSTLNNAYPLLGGKTGSGMNLEQTVEYNTLVAVTEIEGVLVAGAIMDAVGQAYRHLAMKELFDATKQVLQGGTPSSGAVTYATKACSVVVPTCPRTYLADRMKVLYAQNENAVTGVMSVTKVMTAMVLLDYIKDINKAIELKTIDLVGGSGAYFSNGDIVTMKDLMFAMMLPSSNQAAHALGRLAGGEILKYQHFSMF